MQAFQCLISECGDDNSPFLFPNIIATKKLYYPKCILNGNYFKFVPIKVSCEEQVIFFSFFFFGRLWTQWKGIISSCTHPVCSPALWWQTADLWVSTYLIYITCIMYSIWDISFLGLAVSPNTHSDQHIFWGCNHQRNAAVMWEQEEVTWHNGVPSIVLLSSSLISSVSPGAQQKRHELNRVKQWPWVQE